MGSSCFHYRFLSVVAVAALAACSARPRPEIQQPVAISRPAVEIDVQRLPEQGRWRVSYHLASRATALVFERQVNHFRKSRWTVLTPGVQVGLLDGQEALVVEGGASVDQVAVEFGPFTEDLPKDYELFLQFTDGSCAIYTGHLQIRPVTAGAGQAAAAGEEAFPVRTRYHFHGVPGDSLVLRGQTYPDGAADWRFEGGDGTYVYFGRIAAIFAPRLVAIVDPGMPGWLKERTFEWLPRLFDYYTARLGAELTFRPMVLVNFARGDLAEQSSGGGVLEGLVQLTLKGGGWQTPGREAERELLGFLAHEASHLWNSQLVHPPPEQQWLHEGSAEAFQARALLDFGLSDRADFVDRHGQALLDWVQPVRVGGFLANLLPNPARDAKSLAEPQSSQRKVLSWPSPLRLCGSARKFFSCGELCQGLAARSPG